MDVILVLSMSMRVLKRVRLFHTLKDCTSQYSYRSSFSSIVFQQIGFLITS